MSGGVALDNLRQAEGQFTAPPPGQTMSDGGLLSNVKSIKMKQKVAWEEVVTEGCCEKRNKYKLENDADGEKIFKVKEESGCFQRCCCAPFHSAVLVIKNERTDNADYHVKKKFACHNCFACCDFCLPEAHIYKGGSLNKETLEIEGGQVIGHVKRPVCGGVFRPTVDVFDDKEQRLGQIKGPLCCIGACCKSYFPFYKEGQTDADIDEEEFVGIKKLRKKGCDGLMQALFSDADNFRVKFADDMNENHKATMIGAMLLLDFMHFEDDGACQRNGCKIWDWYCCGCGVPCKIRWAEGGEGAE